jgi:hypothetical protein
MPTNNYNGKLIGCIRTSNYDWLSLEVTIHKFCVSLFTMASIFISDGFIMMNKS